MKCHLHLHSLRMMSLSLLRHSMMSVSFNHEISFNHTLFNHYLHHPRCQSLSFNHILSLKDHSIIQSRDIIQFHYWIIWKMSKMSVITIQSHCIKNIYHSITVCIIQRYQSTIIQLNECYHWLWIDWYRWVRRNHTNWILRLDRCLHSIDIIHYA